MWELEEDRPRDECGVFGVFNHEEAAKLTYFGLYALQHRGQESSGISVFRDEAIYTHKGMGLVHEVFEDKTLNRLPGNVAIGQVRYSTTGGSTLLNAQPFVVRHKKRFYAVAHNGNLVNAHTLRDELESSGSIFQTTIDTEIFLHLLIKSLDDGFQAALLKSVSLLKGAFSFVLLSSKGELIGIKDPHGFRPLCLGKLNGSYVLSSESCALDLVEAEYIRELEPGEIVVINRDGVHSHFLPRPERQAFCIFEHIYFARPDSDFYGCNVYEMRKAQGRQLAAESLVDADFVMPFPDSGNYAAIGYAEQSGVPFEMGMIRNHYVGRTFIQPSQSMRDFGVRIKLNPVRKLLKGKRIIIVEDSIIRGTTARTRVRALREIGVKEIHMRVSCPPHRYACHYGIDFSTRGELVAAEKTVDQIRDYLELDSLHYLSLEGLLNSTGEKDPHNRFCYACFNGCYPVAFDEDLSKDCLEK